MFALNAFSSTNFLHFIIYIFFFVRSEKMCDYVAPVWTPLLIIGLSYFRIITKCHESLPFLSYGSYFALRSIPFPFCFFFFWIYTSVCMMGFLASTLNWMKQIFPPIQSVAPATLYDFIYTLTYTSISFHPHWKSAYSQALCK